MKRIVISLGGSLISTAEGIDVKFLKKFRALLLSRVALGEQFIIVIGGGKVCRNYQAALKAVTSPTSDDLDQMGIAATWFNAELVRLIFKDLAYPRVNNTPDARVKFNEPIMTACGNVPGHSSDNDAVHLAKNFGAETVINLTNIDKVYTADPRKVKNAKPLDSVTWQDFLKIVGTKWIPGANFPFDPVASQFAQKNKLKVIIANGNNLTNLKSILTNKKYTGTLIY